ncbi:hypothetical protein [Acidovorax sp. SUPP2825]|uniref:hypothetical protein n=1 Tax=Acidovorax sp. SUPP2825 TaxID=2920879 RepID=UPI0023DE34B5|nr:hypothetical protein [Acidovorax sp. SUPP2825]GKS96942.1 hypothetical protein AVAK2825_20425 [Acidovorax sp. SUPP2825]
MTEKTISAEQVAILAERVDTLLNNHSKIEGLILGISAQQTALAGSVAVFQERLSNMESGQRRLFDLADDHGKELERVISDVKVHSWTWKLVGVAALSSLGLVGWAFSELRALQTSDNRHDNRLAILEFVVGGRNPPKPSEGSKP